MKETRRANRLCSLALICIDNFDTNTPMLQLDGKPDPVRVDERQAWMRLLVRAQLAMLEAEVGPLAGTEPRWLRPPETGLVMCQGRAGGSGARFNLGEVTVTRCALRTDPSMVKCETVGVAYVLGRSHRQAELVATADALLQDPRCRDLLAPDLLERVSAWIDARRGEQLSKAQATKVEFFTVAREAGVPAEAGP
jgi:alpha-D-ribose 1-methylphosphonate 5-triphosphate synthase subunit PhnG